jgi:carotenoid 1,2-hydratase
MTSANQPIVEEGFSFSSSIAADVWHPKEKREGFEWWYFDALSEDGRDAVVIIFLDNFIFSPRYNSQNKKRSAVSQQIKNRFFLRNKKDSSANKFPAVVFVYYRNGKPVYRAINEFSASEFYASQEKPECRIGNNSFSFESAPYGSGYALSINVQLRKKCRLKADFEWLSIESNFLPDRKIEQNEIHNWNLVSPRADVSGKISVNDRNGKNQDNINFRGTGYHDHNFDNRWLPETVKDWHWGRAHFLDSTAVFYRYNEIGQKPVDKLFVIRGGKLHDRNVTCETQTFSRDKFGIKYPQRLRFVSEDNLRLRVKQTQIIDSSFFYLRFLSEMTLTLRDGKPRKTIGITEYLAPKVLKYRWLDWLINMRIGKNGKGSFLP